MRTERKKIQSFLLLVISCVLLFICFGCGGGGQAAVDGNNSSGSAVDSPPVFNPFIGKPPAPIIATANATATSVFLDWTDESNKEDGFYIYRDSVKVGETARNISQWTDTSVDPETTYVYAIIAYNKDGGNISMERIVTTLALPNSPPQLSIVYPMADELVYKLTRIQINIADNDFDMVDVKISVNGVEQLSDRQQASNAYKLIWYEVDFANYEDGIHTISVKITDAKGAKTSGTISVYKNAAELEEKTFLFLLKQSTLWDGYNPPTKYYVVRWPALPLPVEINPILGQKVFDSATRATETFNRLMGISFFAQPKWGSEVVIDTSDCGYTLYGSPLPPNADYRIVFQPHILCKGVSAATNMPDSYQFQFSTPAVIDISPDYLVYTDVASNNFEALLAHELGHSIGIFSHETTTYLMSVENFYYRVSPEMTRALEMLYLEMTPGRIIDFSAYGFTCSSPYNCY